MRDRRTELRLTLRELADRVGCAPSYLSQIENGRRAQPPSERMLAALESALGVPTGALVAASRWHASPEALRLQARQGRQQQQAARELAAALRAGDGKATRSLDDLYRSGELQRLIERLSPGAAGHLETVSLPLEVPLINRVAAGYPTEFTDLGYPARVAAEYVRTPDIRDPDAFAARVVGDSMEPQYREGDIVVFSPSRTVTSGMDCFVRIEPDHETTFKRVYFEQEGTEAQRHEGTEQRGTERRGDELTEGMIRLQPLNPRYPARVLPREQVAGVYAAVSVTRAIGDVRREA